MGTQTVNVLQSEGRAKVGGTLVCVSGAILMIIFKGPALLGYSDNVHMGLNQISPGGQLELSGSMFSSLVTLEINNWQLGGLCLLGNCICFAAFLAVQAPVLAMYSAHLSVTAYSYLFGTLFMVVTTVSLNNESINWNLSGSEALAVIYAGIVPSALNYVLITWSNKILGPALVALYNPLQPAASALLSRIFLGSPIYLGSILGGLLIISELYLVTWGSYREKQQTASGVATSEPLIGQIFAGPSPSVPKSMD